jgi:hypothetical protein
MTEFRGCNQAEGKAKFPTICREEVVEDQLWRTLDHFSISFCLQALICCASLRLASLCSACCNSLSRSFFPFAMDLFVHDFKPKFEALTSVAGYGKSKAAGPKAMSF